VDRAHAWCVACAGALLLGAPREARAEVIWHGAPCGAASQNPVAPGRVEDVGAPRVDIDVVERGAHWVATLTARYPDGSTGTRSIQAATCAELERAVEVSLSLLEPVEEQPASAPNADILGGDATAGSSAPAAVLEAVPSTPASSAAGASGVSGTFVPPSPVSVLTPPADAGGGSEAARPSPRGALGFVRAVALLGSAGGKFYEAGAAFAGGLWFGPWGGRVELSLRRPLSPVSAEHAVSLELQRVAAALDGCVRRRASIEWGLCGGPRLELVTGLSAGPSDPARDSAWLPALGGGAWVRVPIAPRWALSSELQGSWSLRRAEVNVLPWGRVYELPRLGVSLLTGIEWEL
jgi:hypothetical protein